MDKLAFKRSNGKPAAAAVQRLYEPIQSEMEAVDQLLRAELKSDYPCVDELIQYGCLMGGKRLRPALLLLVAKALGPVQPAHTTLAAVVEMIHTATLVHDDVLDEAETRRHLATVNSRWDNKSSVLLGDFLFSHAFYLASTTGSTWACQQIGRATNIVCEGELRQKSSRGDFALTEVDYLSIIGAKTAELCACSCELGAYYADAGEDLVSSMAAFGYAVGTAFQIVDDILDLTGDEVVTGKSLGTDLAQQKLTLPLIHALRTADSRERLALVSGLGEGEAETIDRLGTILQRYGSIEYAQQKARDYVAAARRHLESLPASPIREHLGHLADFVVARVS